MILGTSQSHPSEVRLGNDKTSLKSRSGCCSYRKSSTCTKSYRMQYTLQCAISSGSCTICGTASPKRPNHSNENSASTLLPKNKRVLQFWFLWEDTLLQSFKPCEQMALPSTHSTDFKSSTTKNLQSIPRKSFGPLCNICNAFNLLRRHGTPNFLGDFSRTCLA